MPASLLSIRPGLHLGSPGVGASRGLCFLGVHLLVDEQGFWDPETCSRAYVNNPVSMFGSRSGPGLSINTSAANNPLL
jgi:hypothetical protein